MHICSTRVLLYYIECLADAGLPVYHNTFVEALHMSNEGSRCHCRWEMIVEPNILVLMLNLNDSLFCWDGNSRLELYPFQKKSILEGLLSMRDDAKLLIRGI